jgi:heme ABC exporter ATP-binding subunit CcmA
MDLVIRFRSAVALAGRFPVLAGVDLDVARGEIVALQGPNGAGKTSLLRACAGLLRVVTGEAEVLGVNIVEQPRAVRRKIGLLGHHSGLYEDLTAEDNVTFAARAAGARRESVGPALDRLGITGRLRSTRVGALSAGQRRRVALAAVVARAPQLWLLDEPHAGLDAEHRNLVDTLITESADGGGTVILASHEPDRVGGLADRTITLAGGVITAASTRRASPHRVGFIHVA